MTRQRSKSEDWDDYTPPPRDFSEHQIAAWKAERMRARLSEVSTLVTESTAQQRDLHRRVANLEVDQAQTRVALAELKDGQIATQFLIKQIADELARDKESRKHAAVEGGAWKRSLLALLFPALALAVSVLTLALNKC